MSTDDRYARVEYRRLIAWDQRIRREAPLLRTLLSEAPQRSVVDLGCGTGEHVAFFAQEGARALGIDSSPSMIEKARSHEKEGSARFVLGDAKLGRGLLPDGEAPFGLALCLGNVLPHFQEDAELGEFLSAASSLLQEGGIFLVQLLNYQPILSGKKRHLPLNFRDGGEEGEELVFIRLMKPTEAGRILFFPTTLSLHPDSEEPVRLCSTRRVSLRPWSPAELIPAFAEAGFEVETCGDMERYPFQPEASQDLILIATKRSAT